MCLTACSSICGQPMPWLLGNEDVAFWVSRMNVLQAMSLTRYARTVLATPQKVWINSTQSKR